MEKFIALNEDRVISSEKEERLKRQVDSLQKALRMSDNPISLKSWLKDCERNKLNLSSLLNISGFPGLANEDGIALLDKLFNFKEKTLEKFPKECPMQHW